jgi:hypothetical protein
MGKGKMRIGEIHYSGVFDWGELYRTVVKWLQDRAYRIHEKSYKHKVGGSGAEIEWNFDGYRKHTEYIMFAVYVFVHSYDTTVVEVIRDGKKQKLEKGRLIITLDAEWKEDYSGQFKGPFNEKMKNFLTQQVLGGDKEEGFLWWDVIWYESYRLFNEMKKVLNMETATSAY